MAREPFYDNARFLLVVLVVLTHALEPGRRHDAVGFGVYSSFHLWVIPAFALVSAVFAPTRALTRADVGQLAGRLLLPYLLFHYAYLAIHPLLHRTPYSLDPLTPYWLTWYLMTLFWWRLMLPYIRGVPGIVGLSVVGGLLLGLVPGVGMWLSVARTVVFLPFFLAGHLYGRQLVAALDRPWAPWLGAAVWGGTLVAFGYAGHDVPVALLYAHTPYAELGWSPLEGIAARSLAYAWGFAVMVAFFALVPRTQRWFTPMGAAALYPYLLHGFFLKLLLVVGVLPWGFLRPGGPVVLLGIAVAITALCASPPMQRAMRFAVEPVSWIRRLRTPA
jgi:fucose 4-O-acetylase-like acetyltransferase